MTTRRHPLASPPIQSQTMASRRTARGFHAQELVRLALDAATGHPGQRGTILQNSGDKFSLFIHPATTSRIIEVAITVSFKDDWVPPDGVSVELTIRDGTTTVGPTDPEISRGLKGEIHWPSLEGTRLDSLNRVVRHLDKTALITAGLDPTIPWEFFFDVTCGATVFCELIEVSEVSRFTTNTAETYGDLPEFYLGRSVIDTHLSRLEPTLSAAYFRNRRTYHSLTLGEGNCDTTTSGVLAVIPGSQDGGSGVPKSWVIRPRRILGEAQVQWGVRYRTSGSTDGEIELATGGFASPWVMTLPGTSGAWANAFSVAFLTHGTFADAATDTIQWRASIGSGSLKIQSYGVWDEPF